MAGDGRASFRSVAATMGVNESTVRRRFETLQGRLLPSPAPVNTPAPDAGAARTGTPTADSGDRARVRER